MAFQRSEEGWFEVARLLLAAGANPNLKVDMEHTTPLYLAASNGHCEITQLLLENDGNPEIPEAFGDTPLLMAATEGRSDVVAVLLSPRQPAAVAKADAEAEAAAKAAAVKAVVVVEAGAEAESRGGGEQGKSGGESGAAAATASSAAAGAVVGGFGYDVSGATTAAAAVTAADVKKKAAAAPAAPAPTNRVRAANPNRVRKTDGASALFVAAQDGYLDVVNLLLKHNGNPNLATTDGGDTPLQMAAQENASDVARALLEHDADPDFVHPKHSNGVTALHIAAQLGNAEVLSVLIDVGCANVNAVRAETGATPLIAAAQRGHADVVHKLLAAGADPSVTLIGGKVTAADVGKRHPAVQKVLNEALKAFAAKN